MEAPVEIELVYLVMGLVNSLDCSVSEMVHGCEAYLSTVGQKEWYLVDKEYVCRESHVVMEFEQVLGNLDKVPCHMSGLTSCGLSFEGCDVLSPYLMGSDDVLYGHWAVLDLVALDNPLEIFDRRVSKRGIQSSCLLCAFELSLGEAQLVFSNGVEVECEISILGVIVV